MCYARPLRVHPQRFNSRLFTDIPRSCDLARCASTSDGISSAAETCDRLSGVDAGSWRSLVKNSSGIMVALRESLREQGPGLNSRQRPDPVFPESANYHCELENFALFCRSLTKIGHHYVHRFQWGRNPHHQGGRRLPEGHGEDHLQACCCEKDSCIQGGRDVAVFSRRHRPLDQAAGNADARAMRNDFEQNGSWLPLQRLPAFAMGQHTFGELG